MLNAQSRQRRPRVRFEPSCRCLAAEDAVRMWPQTVDEAQSAMERHDLDSTGFLGADEFFDLALKMLGRCPALPLLLRVCTLLSRTARSYRQNSPLLSLLAHPRLLLQAVRTVAMSSTTWASHRHGPWMRAEGRSTCRCCRTRSISRRSIRL